MLIVYRPFSSLKVGSDLTSFMSEVPARKAKMHESKEDGKGGQKSCSTGGQGGARKDLMLLT